jgi:exosortase/archaeosortase
MIGGEYLPPVCLVLIAYGLFTIIPKLGAFADDLYHLYRDEVTNAFRGRGKMPGI